MQGNAIRIMLAASLFLAAGLAHATSCEEGFKTIGDVRNGLAYAAARTIPGLKPDSALGQLEGIAKTDGFTLGLPTIKDGRGELYFMSTTSRTPVVILASAESSGRVALNFKLARGQSAETEATRTQFCGILNRVKGGAEGEALARTGRAGNAAGVVDADPVKLAAQLRKEIDRAMLPADTPLVKDLLLGTNTPRNQRADVNALFAPIRLRYLGRRYRLDGQVNTLRAAHGVGRINFLVAPKRGLLQVQQAQGYFVPFSVACILHADQADYFNVLEAGNQVKLEGVVDEVTEHNITLRDCRQAG